MAVNHFFQNGNGIGNKNEAKLHEDLIIEGLKIFGHDVYYLPRTLVNQDLILGEDVASKFNAAYLAEMYMETTEGFAGQQEIINKFGLEIRNSEIIITTIITTAITTTTTMPSSNHTQERMDVGVERIPTSNASNPDGVEF